jgi:hypothetical protein
VLAPERPFLVNCGGKPGNKEKESAMLEELKEVETIIRKNFTSPESQWELDHALKQVADGTDESQVALSRAMYGYFFRTGWTEGDQTRARKLLLAAHEQLAERGNPVAMRYAAIARSESRSGSVDYPKACEWAKKGAEKGDEVCIKILPGLEADMKRQSQNAPQPPGP